MTSWKSYTRSGKMTEMKLALKFVSVWGCDVSQHCWFMTTVRIRLKETSTAYSRALEMVDSVWMCIKWALLCSLMHIVSVDIINWNCWLLFICLCCSVGHLLRTLLGNSSSVLTELCGLPFESWHTENIIKHRIGDGTVFSSYLSVETAFYCCS